MMFSKNDQQIPKRSTVVLENIKIIKNCQKGPKKDKKRTKKGPKKDQKVANRNLPF